MQVSRQPGWSNQPTTPVRPAAIRNVLIPLAFYLFAYFVLTFPAITHFSTDFFMDAGDGLKTTWDVWWVGHAVKSGTNPWFTRLLHYPLGTTLIADTLTPFNGFTGVVFGKVMTLVQTVNALIIFAFVVGGLIAFWLSLEITGEYYGSLLCGYLFSFSQYHFAHTEGHLQLVTLEWLPLFLLAFWRLLARPSVARGVAAACSLFLVIFSDYYYFLYSVLAGAILLGWYLIAHRSERPWRQRSVLLGLGAFVVVSSVLCGPQLFALLRQSLTDPLAGAHDPTEWSLDLLAPFIPGGHWRFAEWTRWYWHRLPGNIHESSVAWGLSVTALVVVAWASRLARRTWLGIWFILLAFFGVMALGPNLRILGRRLDGIPGPYAALEWIVPPLKLSGCPVRMSVMTSLSVALIAGFGFAILWRRAGWTRGLAILLAAGAVFETWPREITLTPNVVPPYVGEMRSLSKDFALFDVDEAFGASKALFYQTVHGIPMVHGYIARFPESVLERDTDIDTRAELGQWQLLCERYGIRYLVFGSDRSANQPLATARILQGPDGALRFYDVGRLWSCSANPEKTTPPLDLPLRWEPSGPRQFEVPGATCLVESLNSRNPYLGRRPWTLPRSGTIKVIGWAIQRESEGAPESVRVRLEASDGTSYEAPARRLVRPDVAQHFGSPNYRMAGFRLGGPVAALPVGTYRLSIVQEDGARRAFCDTGLKVALR